MKKITLMAGICLLLFACKKSSTSPAGNSAQTSGQLASIRIYSPSVPSLIVDTFVYDGKKNMLRAGYAAYDSVIAGAPYIDSGSYYFTFNSGSQVPASYRIISSKEILLPGPPVLQDETHGLSYDSEDRLIGDTLLVNRVSSNTVDAMTWYAYAGTSIVGATGDTPDSIDITDSLVFNSAGNLVREADIAGPLSSPYDTSSYTVSAYSPYPNPMYNVTNALNIGIFLLNNGIVDAASKNLPADNIAKWNLDSSGRVVSTIGTDGTITKYTYN
jgi:hypothetical protein